MFCIKQKGDKDMAAKKETKALVALAGYEDKHKLELVRVVNSTAVLLLDGKEIMTGEWNVTPLNKKAKVMLGKEEE